MSLRHIEVFHAVYTAGSVIGAAQSLHVSQPSVSKVLRHAESRLGYALFRRVKGRLAPTDEAHALFREVDELYGRIGSLQITARNLKRGGEGHIRLAVVPSLGLGIAPQAIARFRRRYPQVSFDVRTVHHSEILKVLYERESDIVVAFEAPPHPRLTLVDMAIGRVGLLYREADLPEAPEALDLAVLEGRDVIGIVGSGPVGALVSAEMETHGLGLAEVISVHTYYVAAALVRHGAGMAVVDEYTARSAIDDQIRFRPLAPAVRFRVQCVHLDDRAPSGATAAFVETLVQVFAEQGQA
ncbi:LysR family transcriptional regulator [Phenylobacterium aquaticum]|uniref:LysR family transcriptional regulator n=1 Tax=Phenylobacterium aquaticum TaxID=1763816 RepID=UPI001F5C4BFB|nr:LysR family transcriptional regulator [Phenylobacterium aquaticum]MCI3131193.1 LysR family transcriptional regulator [Phenylobacterium aquaticum]